MCTARCHMSGARHRRRVWWGAWGTTPQRNCPAHPKGTPPPLRQSASIKASQACKAGLVEQGLSLTLPANPSGALPPAALSPIAWACRPHHQLLPCPLKPPRAKAALGMVHARMMKELLSGQAQCNAPCVRRPACQRGTKWGTPAACAADPETRSRTCMLRKRRRRRVQAAWQVNLSPTLNRAAAGGGLRHPTLQAPCHPHTARTTQPRPLSPPPMKKEWQLRKARRATVQAPMMSRRTLHLASPLR